MKKSLLIIFALLLIVSVFCGCAKSDSTETAQESTNNITATGDAEATAPTTTNNIPEGELTAENVVKIYMDNIDTWKHSSEQPQWYGYLFLDFNSDGVLELVKTTISGYKQISHNNFYRIDKDTNTVVEIPFPDKDEENQCDFNGMDYPDLYKNNATGEFRFMTSDYSRSDSLNTSTVIGEMYMDENGNLHARNLWSLDIQFDGEDYANAAITYNIFDEEGNKSSVSEETYLQTLENYEKENTNMLLEFKTVIGQGDGAIDSKAFAELDADSQYKLLLESYNTYKY
ncbi:MAG: hypothetical protein E7566_01785 [Ruminococcaceae bacterium]|nr:hypothetical protein [Oscillospiraceae bacterium]